MERSVPVRGVPTITGEGFAAALLLLTFVGRRAPENPSVTLLLVVFLYFFRTKKTYGFLVACSSYLTQKHQRKDRFIYLFIFFRTVLPAEDTQEGDWGHEAPRSFPCSKPPEVGQVSRIASFAPLDEEPPFFPLQK